MTEQQANLPELRNVKDNGNATFDCEFNHPEFGWIPFTAAPNDVEELGRSIYKEITESSSIVITPYTPPTIDEMAQDERLWRDGELSWFDIVCYRNQLYWESLSDDEKARRMAYREALLNYPELDGFPTDISLRPPRIEITD